MQYGIVEQGLELWSRAKTLLFSLLLRGQFQEFGAGSRVEPPFRCHGLGQMALGRQVKIHRDSWLQVVLGHGASSAPKLVIQDHADIGMGAQISAAQRITLGRHILLSRNVYISDHAHAFADPAVPIADQGITNIQPVVIGDHSWLGQNVVVLPGVTIGRHCVIGANSVVNRSIPDFVVAAGVPARFVRRYNPATAQWERTGSPMESPPR